MKKGFIILLIVAVVISALCIWQRNNIKAVYLFFKYDKADIEKMIEDNKNSLDEKIKEYSEYVPRPLTQEEEAKIASGELSPEDAAKMLLEGEETATAPEVDGEVTASEQGGEVQPDNQNKDEQEKTSPADNIEANKKKEGEIIRNYTAQFYSMKAYYIGQLSAIEAQARKDYAAMSKEEKKNLSKTAFLNKYIGYATSLQNECDTKVTSLLKTMKDELKAVGGDVAIIDVIKQAYENEKAARKAYYMNMVS